MSSNTVVTTQEELGTLRYTKFVGLLLQVPSQRPRSANHCPTPHAQRHAVCISVLKYEFRLSIRESYKLEGGSTVQHGAVPGLEGKK